LSFLAFVTLNFQDESSLIDNVFVDIFERLEPS
jgi:hypothetical protein